MKRRKNLTSAASAMKWILLVCLTFGMSMTGCKDYGDDIDKLKEDDTAIKAQITSLTTKITALEADIAALKANGDPIALSKAEAALKAAQDLKTDLGLTGDQKINIVTLSASVDAINALIGSDGNELKALITKATDLEKAQGEMKTQLILLQAQQTALEKFTGYTGTAETKSLLDRIAALESGAPSPNNDLATIKTWLGDNLTKFKDLSAMIDAKIPGINMLSSLVSQRLTSLVFVPEYQYDGISTIVLKAWVYTPKMVGTNGYLVDKVKPGTTTPVDKVGISVITDVKFKMNSSGITLADVGVPTFINKTNIYVTTRAALPKEQAIEIVDYKNGISGGEWTLQVRANAIYDWKPALRDQANPDEGLIDMVALKVPLAGKALTDEEKAAGKEVLVHSEYVRAFLVEHPAIYISNNNSEASVLTQFKWYEDSLAVYNKKYFAFSNGVATAPVEAGGGFVNKTGQLGIGTLNGALTNSLYTLTAGVGFDSKKVIATAYTDVVSDDAVCVTGKSLDLNTVTTASYIKGNRAVTLTAAELKKYGLSFRWVIATKANLWGANNTDQQRFGKIADAKAGIFTPQVYGNEDLSAAIDRTPIVRVTLWDDVNNTLVDQKYMRIRIIKEAKPGKTIEIPFGNKALDCLTADLRLLTPDMNTMIYNPLGYSKNDFHVTYTTFDQTDNKYVILPVTTPRTVTQVPDAGDHSSYNILWDIANHLTTAQKAKLSAGESVFIEAWAKYVGTGINGDVNLHFTATLVPPTISVIKASERWDANDTHAQINLNVPVTNKFLSMYCNYEPDLKAFFAADVVVNNKMRMIYSPAETAPATKYTCVNPWFEFSAAKVTDKNGKDIVIGGSSTVTVVNTLVAGVNRSVIYVGGVAVATIGDLGNASYPTIVDKDQIYLLPGNTAIEDALNNTGSVIIKDVLIKTNLVIPGIQIPVKLDDTKVNKFNVEFIRPVYQVAGKKTNFTDAVTNGSEVLFRDAFIVKNWNKVDTVWGKTLAFAPGQDWAVYHGVTNTVITSFFQDKNSAGTWVNYTMASTDPLKGTWKLNATKIKTNRKVVGGVLKPDLSITYATATETLNSQEELYLRNTVAGQPLNSWNMVFFNNGGYMTEELTIWIPVVLHHKWGHLVAPIEMKIKPSGIVTP